MVKILVASVLLLLLCSCGSIGDKELKLFETICKSNGGVYRISVGSAGPKVRCNNGVTLFQSEYVADANRRP